MCYFCCFFFFQAEDGIRDRDVTGVQTCALPILQQGLSEPLYVDQVHYTAAMSKRLGEEIGGALQRAILPGRDRPPTHGDLALWRDHGGNPKTQLPQDGGDGDGGARPRRGANR